MLVEVKVPVLAESVPDATLLEWRKKAGERVERGENLIDLETDKVTLEVAAPEAGVLVEIRKQTGEVVLTEDILAIIDTAAAGVATSATAVEPVVSPTPTAEPTKMGPAAKKILGEKGVDPAAVAGSGKDGRITKADALSAGGTPIASPAKTPPEPTVSVSTNDPRGDQRVPMTRLRKRTAERLLQAQQQAAILTTFNEVNMQPVMDLRNRYKDDFEKRHGVKMGFMSFFVRAAVEALKKFPVVNAFIDGDDIVYHPYFDLGVAVSSERGLVVPILRNAETLSFAEIELKIREFGERARDGKLTIEELSGGTFTISNGGIFGSLVSTPILNPPQSAILGMHKIQDRPVVEKGAIVIRPMMYLAMSYDHRIVDGREAVQCLDTIKQMLEDPSRMLLQV